MKKLYNSYVNDVRKGMLNVTHEIESLFEPLFNEFNVFFKREENEVGCLTEKQHKKMMAIYNDIDTIFIQVLNENVEQIEEKKVCEDLQTIFVRDDEDEAEKSINNSRALGIEIC